MANRRRITLALAALGGQGGGVVSGWLTAVAGRDGYLAQATSVPGVAQRTGATLYYFEFFPKAALPPDGRLPVLALMPSPGDVDVVVASELIEAGRVLHRGIVTPDRTTLIASTHRVYTISEKAAMGDGRVDAGDLLKAAQQSARQLITMDMAELAERHGAVISSVILGAIAGSGVLPFAAETYRAVIRAQGIAVDANLSGFDAGLAVAQAGKPEAVPAAAALPAALPEPARRHIHDLLPPAVWQIAEHAYAKLCDYQDTEYAEEYLRRVQEVYALEPATEGPCALTSAYARGLALWMSVEDTIRVADLKTRAERIEGIRKAQRLRPGQILHIREYLKPRVEEICGTLPRGLGAWIMASPGRRRLLAPLTRGMTVSTTALTGHLTLRAVAGLRRWRRSTLRFSEVEAERARWTRAVKDMAARNYEAAVEIAHCQRLAKGYGETYERGTRNLERIMTTAERIGGRADAPALIARLRDAALKDERGEAMEAVVNEIAGAQEAP